MVLQKGQGKEGQGASLKTHAPQIWRVEIHTPNLRGESSKNTCSTVFSGTSGGQILGFKRSKSRGGEEKTKAKEGRQKKEGETWKHEEPPPFLVGVFLANFNDTIGGKLRLLTNNCPSVEVFLIII